MASLTTNFSVGDVVWSAGTQTEQRQHPCPDCKGGREWKAVSPAGDEFAFACPRCSARYNARDELTLTYTAHAPRVERLTIGSVRVDTNSDKPVSYMCTETGVGSGSVYYETDLFPTQEAAQRAAEALAKLRDETVEWAVKRFNKTLEISDYQLASAAMRDAQTYKSRAGSLLYNLSDLFDAINEAGDRDEILAAVDEYRQRDWERDKAKFAEFDAKVPA